MALKSCRECREMVSTEAKVCPKCGTPSPTRAGVSWITMLGGGFILFVIIIGIIGAVASGPDGNNTNSHGLAPSMPVAAAAPPPAPPIEIDARALYAAYDDNEVAADNQYKGRRLQVTGMVASIDKDFLDNIVVWLKTGNDFGKVMAKMDKSAAGQAARLSKRTRVALACEGNGRVMSSPTLSDCTFVGQ